MINAILIAALVVIALAAAGWWFVHWNLRGKPAPLALKAGDPLPEFHAEDEDGKRLSSTGLRARPAVILFVRGNWCPFCTRQVADLTKYYKEITELGARLVFVTPKPLGTTRRVAEIFDVEFEFWLDPDLSIAEQLGLVHSAGVPGNHRGQYGSDTVWPTALVCNADGVITYTSQSRKIVDRPDPQILVGELRRIA